MAQFYTCLLQIKLFGGFYPLTELWNNCHFNLAAMQYATYITDPWNVVLFLEFFGYLGQSEHSL